MCEPPPTGGSCRGRGPTELTFRAQRAIQMIDGGVLGRDVLEKRKKTNSCIDDYGAMAVAAKCISSVTPARRFVRVGHVS